MIREVRIGSLDKGGYSRLRRLDKVVRTGRLDKKCKKRKIRLRS